MAIELDSTVAVCHDRRVVDRDRPGLTNIASSPASRRFPQESDNVKAVDVLVDGLRDDDVRDQEEGDVQ